jgi:hypothetical protein
MSSVWEASLRFRLGRTPGLNLMLTEHRIMSAGGQPRESEVLSAANPYAVQSWDYGSPLVLRRL